MLKLRSVQFDYPQQRLVEHSQPVLNNVSFEVDQPGVIGLLGPNGCGKSTLLQVAAGILPINTSDPQHHGAVFYDNQHMTSLSMRQLAAKRAYLAQQSEWHFSFSVRQVVAMGRSHQDLFFRTEPDDQELDVLLEQLDLMALAERQANTLSGGERQRAMLARTLWQQSPIKLLDEPLHALDIFHLDMVLKILRQRAEKGEIIVMAVHDVNMAMHACDRVLLMHAGKIVADGQPRDVLTPVSLEGIYGIQMVAAKHPHSNLPILCLDMQHWAASQPKD